MTRMTWAYLGLGGIGLYWLWKNTASATPSPQGGASPVASMPFVPAVTVAQVQQGQSFWSTLTPVSPLSAGYIIFPSGSQVAASLMGAGNTAVDGAGNAYVQWAGRVYQLGAQDSSGNYPAALVGSPGAPASTNAAFNATTFPGVAMSATDSGGIPNWLGL